MHKYVYRGMFVLSLGLFMYTGWLWYGGAQANFDLEYVDHGFDRNIAAFVLPERNAAWVDSDSRIFGENVRVVDIVKEEGVVLKKRDISIISYAYTSSDLKINIQIDGASISGELGEFLDDYNITISTFGLNKVFQNGVIANVPEVCLLDHSENKVIKIYKK